VSKASGKTPDDAAGLRFVRTVNHTGHTGRLTLRLRATYAGNSHRIRTRLQRKCESFLADTGRTQNHNFRVLGHFALVTTLWVHFRTAPAKHATAAATAAAITTRFLDPAVHSTAAALFADPKRSRALTSCWKLGRDVGLARMQVP
jgi:hypothetical protein